MDYTNYKHFSIERRGRIITLMLNRPPMNPIHYELHEELSRFFTTSRSTTSAMS